MENFTYNSKYGSYEDCYFRVGSYENGNLAIEIWNNEDGPITKVTVNPDIEIPRDKIAVKDYSENEGMVDWLRSMNIISGDPEIQINTLWVTIPVYELTSRGKSILGLEEVV